MACSGRRQGREFRWLNASCTHARRSLRSWSWSLAWMRSGSISHFLSGHYIVGIQLTMSSSHTHLCDTSAENYRVPHGLLSYHALYIVEAPAVCLSAKACMYSASACAADVSSPRHRAIRALMVKACSIPGRSSSVAYTGCSLAVVPPTDHTFRVTMKGMENSPSRLRSTYTSAIRIFFVCSPDPGSHAWPANPTWDSARVASACARSSASFVSKI